MLFLSLIISIVEACIHVGLCVIADLASQTAGDEFVTYTGSVVEFRAYSEWTPEGGVQILRENTLIFNNYAQQAKHQGADILVFPEYGLIGLDLGETDEDFHSLTQIVPDPALKIVPCLEDSNTHTYQALRNLSCLARDLQIYLVIDLAEWQQEPNITTDVYFNTQAVLDRSGAVIARYRKKNLFFEYDFTPGDESPETAIFQTDFGVQFGLQICFDIMYDDPAIMNVESGIYDVIMSTAWVDELPFLTAIQIFSAWSKGLGVNLLVSGHHKPEEGSMGSGIFSNYINNSISYIFNKNIQSTLITRQITTRKSQSLKEVDAELEVFEYAQKLMDLFQTREGNAKEMVDNKKGSLGQADILVVENVEEDWGSKNSQRPLNILEIPHQNDENQNSDNVLEQGISRLVNSKAANNETISHYLVHEDLSNYTTLILPSSAEMQTISLCHNTTFCCNLTYIFELNYSILEDQDPNINGNYRLMSFAGLVPKGGGEYWMGVQECAVVYCFNQTLESCSGRNDPVNMTSEFRLVSLEAEFDTVYIYPSIFTLNFDLLDNSMWNFVRESRGRIKGSMDVFTEFDNLLTASLFGRLYRFDP